MQVNFFGYTAAPAIQGPVAQTCFSVCRNPCIKWSNSVLKLCQFLVSAALDWRLIQISMLVSVKALSPPKFHFQLYLLVYQFVFTWTVTDVIFEASLTFLFVPS